MVSGFEKFMLSFKKTSPENLKQLENKALHNLVTCDRGQKFDSN